MKSLSADYTVWLCDIGAWYKGLAVMRRSHALSKRKQAARYSVTTAPRHQRWYQSLNSIVYRRKL